MPAHSVLSHFRVVLSLARAFCVADGSNDRTTDRTNEKQAEASDAVLRQSAAAAKRPLEGCALHLFREATICSPARLSLPRLLVARRKRPAGADSHSAFRSVPFRSELGSVRRLRVLHGRCRSSAVDGARSIDRLCAAAIAAAADGREEAQSERTVSCDARRRMTARPTDQLTSRLTGARELNELRAAHLTKKVASSSANGDAAAAPSGDSHTRARALPASSSQPATQQRRRRQDEHIGNSHAARPPTRARSCSRARAPLPLKIGGASELCADAGKLRDAAAAAGSLTWKPGQGKAIDRSLDDGPAARALPRARARDARAESEAALLARPPHNTFWESRAAASRQPQPLGSARLGLGIMLYRERARENNTTR